MDIQQEKNKKQQNLRSIFVSVAAILICVSGFIAIKAEPFPFVMQNMFVILVAAIFGGTQGTGAVGLFFILGALGFPVFSGSIYNLSELKGIAYISKTINGSFIIGYFIAALVTGFYIGTPSKENKTPAKKIAIGCFLGFVAVYVPFLFKFVDTSSAMGNTIISAMIPYLVFDLAKCAVTIPLAIVLRTKIAKHLF